MGCMAIANLVNILLCRFTCNGTRGIVNGPFLHVNAISVTHTESVLGGVNLIRKRPVSMHTDTMAFSLHISLKIYRNTTDWERKGGWYKS